MHDDPTLPLGDLQRTAAEMPALRDTWGPFRLLARVGSGGFGEVYRAWDPNLEREVALKLLLPGVVGGEEEYKAMLREARAMASVLHPNIVHVYGIDRHDDRVGFWTDFIKGKTLSALLGSQGPFGYREAALIGIDVSRALSAVHRAGLLHRDIKAENVMREEGGRILLMDFGLSAGERSFAGQIAGTPNYMAPELFEGHPATVCSDIYALGVLLYYLVIAEYPARLTGLTANEAKAALARRTPLMDLRSDLPEPFLRAIRMAMDLDPGKRYSSAGQLADALAESLGTGMTTPTAAYAPVTSYGQPPTYTPTPSYGQTPSYTPTPSPSYGQTTPAARPAPPPPPPPPPAPVDKTWANLFGGAAWIATLSRRKKWALFCVAIFVGQRVWHQIVPEHKEASSSHSEKATAEKDSDNDDSDVKDAEDMLRKAYTSSNVASALKVFQNILQDDPDSASAQAGVGSAYFKQYRSTHDPKLLELAKTATNRALTLDKDGKLVEPHVTMANIDAVEGQTSPAMTQAQKALTIDPKSAAAYGALANVYQAEGKKADAVTAAKKAMDLAPDEAEWPLLLGSLYSAQGDAKAANAQWQKSIDVDSDNAEAYVNLGRESLRLDNLPEAHDHFEKVAEIQPTSMSYKALAMVLILQGKPGDAVDAAQKAVKLNSLDYESWGTLGRAQRIKGDREDAAKSYAKAIDLGEGARLNSPNDPQLLVHLANYYAASGKPELASERLKKALENIGKDRSIDYEAAVVYALLGQSTQSVSRITSSLALGSHVVEIEHSPELASERSNVAVQVLMATRAGKGGRVIVMPNIVPPVIIPPTPPKAPKPPF